MAAPTPGTAVGHAGNPTTSSSTTLGATAADTILVLVGVNAGATTALTPGGTYNGGAWTSIAAGSGTAQWGGAWWSRCTGNHTGQTVTLATATDSTSAAILPVTGCLTGATPIDTNVSSANVTASGLGLAAFDTTVADTLVVFVGAIDDNVALSGPTKGGSAMALDINKTSTGGADSQVFIATLAQAGVGTTGAFAGTHADTDSKRLIAFALKPIAEIVYNDSPSGTLAISGSNTESVTRSSTPTGTVAVTGSIVESWEGETLYNDAPAGTLVLSGSLSRSTSFNESPQGTLALTGSLAEFFDGGEVYEWKHIGRCDCSPVRTYGV